MRSIIQSISYEITISIAIFYFCFLFSSLRFFYFRKLINKFVNFMCRVFILIIILINLIIECRRRPFDLTEGESELVSGFNVEYGGVEFSLIFLGENVIIIFNSMLIGFFCVPISFLTLRTFFILCIILIIRGRFPRIRFDIMIILC